MPSKRTNKKKQKKKAALMEETSAKDISEWAVKGRMDAKGLSSSLPGVAEAIREGSMKPSELPKVVEQANRDHILNELKEVIPADLLKAKPKRFESFLILNPHWDPVLYDLCRVACGSNNNLLQGFANDFIEANKLAGVTPPLKKILAEDATVQSLKTSISLEEWKLLMVVHKTYLGTCQKWKSAIESFTKKPLQETRHAYYPDFLDFLMKCCELVDRRENYGLEQMVQDMAYTRVVAKQEDKKVEASAKGVQAVWDTARFQCWECGASEYGKECDKCSLCKAARYCSVDCQRKSWKSGHKEACANLKCMYQSFTHNYKRVDKALARQEAKDPTPMVEGCPLAPAGAKDYIMVSLMLMKEGFPLQPNLTPLGGTTIDHMYKSLADIVSGKEHWMFDDTFQGTLQEYLDTTVIERADDTEMKYVIRGLLFLGNDLSKVQPPHRLHEWVHAMKQQLRELSKRGELMPVARFIGIYYRLGLAHREGYEDPAARLQNLAKCLTAMIKCAHKSTTVEDHAIQKAMAEFNGKLDD